MSTRETLVVFDIDGTLLHSDGAHNELITVVLARHGLDATIKPFGTYTHYTDWCVIDEVHQATHGEPVAPELLARLDVEYREALEEHLDGVEVAEVAGAQRLVEELQGREGVHVAFATGSLRSMAALKLSLIGVDAEREVLASASEHYSRDALVRGAVTAVAERIGHDRLDVVILGDGAWDETTARQLGIPFVGLTTGAHEFAEDAVLVVGDFTATSAADLVALARPWSVDRS